MILDEGPNPYADHEAIWSFLELYTGKQRKDSRKWMDYFTSDAFLDVAWERRFAALLLEHVTSLEGEYPVNREFLSWLCIAYQFSVIRTVYQDWNGENQRIEFHFPIEWGFEGQDFIFEIAKKGPAPKKQTNLEKALCSSFAEYHRLVKLAENGRWNEWDLKAAGSILDFYMLGNFEDRNPRGSERHPAGMRLINHFFQREKLPKALYQMAWQRLELKTALMGRAQLLYGKLRERVLEQVPDIAADELDIWQLNKEFEVFRQRVRALEGTGRPEDWEKAGEETKAFLLRPVFQKALRYRRFAEEHMKYHVQWSGEHFAQEILDFYRQNPEAPCAAQLTQLILESRRRREIELRNQQDQGAAIPETISLASRPFFRHWLNTGFFRAQDRESGCALLDYLNEELPFLPEWSKRFLEVEDGEVPNPVTVTCTLDGDTVEVRFHLRYMSFSVNGEPIHRPCLPWERAAALADTDTLFFLRPITTATYDQYEAVRVELLRRLADTAAPEDGWAFIAGCLADQVCGLPVPGEARIAWNSDGEEKVEIRPLPPESVLPFEIFAEDGERLLVCVWFQRGQELALFQQTSHGRQLARDGAVLRRDRRPVRRRHGPPAIAGAAFPHKPANGEAGGTAGRGLCPVGLHRNQQGEGQLFASQMGSADRRECHPGKAGGAAEPL